MNEQEDPKPIITIDGKEIAIESLVDFSDFPTYYRENPANTMPLWSCWMTSRDNGKLKNRGIYLGRGAAWKIIQDEDGLNVLVAIKEKKGRPHA